MNQNERASRYLKDANLETSGRGKLKIFFGYAAGVGKTYSMLAEAQDLKQEGQDVIIGYLEDHGRADTRNLARGLESIPVKKESYKGMYLQEFNLDGALERHPQTILVDELAHTNTKKSRHLKRYQDIQELLTAGINVYTTLNVQHLESLHDIIFEQLNVDIQERVPDYIFDMANQVKLIDIEPNDLINRLKIGKIYARNHIRQALANFFKSENLTTLRELALRKMTLRLATNSKVGTDRLLVCLSGSKSNERVIRSAAQMAQAFNSDFIAVYVKNNQFNKWEENLNNNISLAHQLGAKVIKLQGENPALQITEYAKESSVTKIVLGASPYKKIWQTRSTLVYQIGYLLPEVDEYVINSAKTNLNQVQHLNGTFLTHFKGSLSKSGSKRMAKNMLMISSVILGSTVVGELLIFAQVPLVNVVLVYMLGIMLCAINLKDQVYGFLSAFLAVISFNLFFTKPYFSLSSSPVYLLTFFLMLLVSIISNYWTLKLKHQVQYNSNRVYQTEVLLETIRKLQQAKLSTDIIDTTVQQLQKIYSATMVFYECQDSKLLQPKIYLLNQSQSSFYEFSSDNEKAIATWAFKNGQEAGLTTNTLPQAKCLYLPIFGNSPSSVVAVIGLAINSKRSLEIFDRNLIISILDECGQALSRMRILNEKRKAEIKSHQEKLRANLLRGISHDLRTPLTNISGSADILKREGNKLSDVEKYTLYESIFNDSSWLISLVENLLAMTRLESSLQVRHSPELIDDIIQESLQHLSPGFEDHKITVNLSDPLLMVMADAHLITQVIINIVNNAIQHTPEKTKISIRIFQKNTNQVQFEISNNGPKLTNGDLAHLFGLFYTGKQKQPLRAQRGLGIGLSLCKSIIEAYDGNIWAKNLNNGVCFYFTLPIWSKKNEK